MLCRVGLGIVSSVSVALPVPAGITQEVATTPTTSYSATLMAGQIETSKSGFGTYAFRQAGPSA